MVRTVSTVSIIGVGWAALVEEAAIVVQAAEAAGAAEALGEPKCRGRSSSHRGGPCA